MLGSIGDWLSVGGIDHSVSIGVVFSVVMGLVVFSVVGLDGEVSTSGCAVHPTLTTSDKIRMTDIARYFIFIPFTLVLDTLSALYSITNEMTKS